jgi:hypothetical protein
MIMYGAVEAGGGTKWVCALDTDVNGAAEPARAALNEIENE